MSSDNGDNYTPISRSDKDTNSHIVQNLSNGTEYSFAVRAVNCPANGVAAMVSETPLFDAPTGLTATAGYGEVMLGWDNPGNNNITGYDLSIDGGNSYTSVASDSTDLIYNSQDNTIEYTMTGLTGGTSYAFAVRAVNGAPAMVTATPLFAAPTGLSATAGDGQVTLSWDDPLNNSISSYELSIDGGTFAEISGSDKDTTGHTVQNLTNGTTYSFAVRAVNASGEGASSDTVSATPLIAAPAGLTAEAGDGQVKLIWTNPLNSDITGYELSIDGGEFAEIVGSDEDTTDHTETGLINGASYTFGVRAVYGAAAMVTATPAALIVSFGASNYEATEGGSDARVTVSLSASAGGVLTIPITTNPTSGDFALSATSLSFAAEGDQTKTITVRASADTDLNDEQVVLGFGTLPEGVSTGRQSTTTVTLKDKGQEETPPPPPPPPVPGRPGNLTATPDDRAVALSWTAAANNGSPITKYQHRRSDTGWEDVPGEPTATEVTVSGLTNGVEYVFYVRAVSSAGAGAEASVSATPAAVPDAPGNLTATPDDRAVALSWTAAANNGSPITKYQHRRSDTGWEDVPGGPTATEVTVSGLTNGVEYVFYVRAVSSAGAGAEASVSATPAAVPDAPGNLTATPDDRAVALSWTAAANNGSPITKYQHRRSDTGWEDVPGEPTATEVTVSGLTNGVEYVFYVRAVSSAGAGAEASVSATPAAVPDAPGNLTATPDDRAVALSWTAAANNGSPITKYQHRRSDTGWEDVPGEPTATEVTVSGLTNGVEYVFYVRAVSSAGAGAEASVSATPAAVPDAPGNLTATPDDRAVALSWTAAANNGSPITKYQHQRDDAPWADIAGGATANSLTVTGLVDDTRYTFSVRAVNGMGEGAVASVTAAPQTVRPNSGSGGGAVPPPEPTPMPTATPESTPIPTATPEPTPMPTATPEPTPTPTAALKPMPMPAAAPKPKPMPAAALKPTPTPAAAPEPTQRVVLTTPTPEAPRTPVLTATMAALSAGGAVAATPTAAPVVGPTPPHIATPTPALRARVIPTATIEPASRTSTTTEGTLSKEVPSEITDFPVVPVGIGLFAVLIAALAALLLASRRRR